MFGVPEFSEELEGVVARYGIEVLKTSEITEIDAGAQSAVVRDNTAETTSSIKYDFFQVVPPQSAERKDMWYLKRHGLPFMYWNLMLKGPA